MVTIRHLCDYFEAHAEIYYRKPNGDPTRTIYNVKSVTKELCDTPWESTTVGKLPADQMTPKLLYHVQQSMATSGRLSRVTANDRLQWIKTIFRWAAHPAREYVSLDLPHQLDLITPLKRGRSPAKDLPRVEPVPLEHVEATLRYAPPMWAAIIRTQWATGMRPGEVCVMQRSAIDNSRDIWIYKPTRHKTEHFGKDRHVAILPEIQPILMPMIMSAARDWLFEGGRHKPNGKPVREQTYRTAIARINEKHNLTHWHPHQIRHAFATRMSKIHDPRTVQVLMGHSSVRMTEHYTKVDFLDAVQKVAG